MALAETTASSLGVEDACYVTIPHPVGMQPVADIEKKAEEAFPEILRLATDWRPATSIAAGADAYPAERIVLTGDEMDVNRRFLDDRWSLGLPIIPPTVERVAEMLKGTRRRPDEVLGQVPPENGSLTVELVAVSAVMAGCKPQYMPLLIAALEGFLSPEANWRGSLTTTGTTQSVVVVNGPVIGRLGVGHKQGAAGKGYHPNASVGYAINLVAYNVGGSRPPGVDRSTLASPADYVCWVFGENEEALPAGWEPLHVDRGFERGDSTVTVLSTYPPVENIDHWSANAEEYMRWWSYTASPLQNMGGPSIGMLFTENPIIALGPEHAQLVAAGGRSKLDFCRDFWESVRAPLSAWPPGCADRSKVADYLGPVTEDTMIPVTQTAEQLMVVIGGGDGKHAHYFAPFPGCYPVTKRVDV